MFSPLIALMVGKAEVVLQIHLQEAFPSIQSWWVYKKKEAKAAFRLQWQFENAIECALCLPSVNTHLFTGRVRETKQVQDSTQVQRIPYFEAQLPEKQDKNILGTENMIMGGRCNSITEFLFLLQISFILKTSARAIFAIGPMALLQRFMRHPQF